MRFFFVVVPLTLAVVAALGTTTTTTALGLGDDDDNNIQSKRQLATGSSLSNVFVSSNQQVVHTVDKKTTIELINTTPNLSQFAQAIRTTNLSWGLSGIGPYTVLAPYNIAFDTAPAYILNKLLQQVDQQSNEWILHLRNVIQYHIHDGEIKSNSIIVAAAQTPPTSSRTIRMRNGQNAQIVSSGNDNRVTINGGVRNLGYFEPINGVVYMIETILLPPFLTQSLVDVISASSTSLTTSSSSTSTLASLIVTAGLDEILKSSDAEFTIFAPTNSAFDALDADLLAFLKSPEGMATLETVLLYHVIPSIHASINIPQGIPNTLTTLDSDKQTIKVVRNSDDTNSIMVNDNIMVSIPDVLANNGIMHIIPKVLLPPILPDAPLGGNTIPAVEPILPVPVVPVPVPVQAPVPVPVPAPVPVPVPAPTIQAGAVAVAVPGCCTAPAPVRSPALPSLPVPSTVQVPTTQTLLLQPTLGTIADLIFEKDSKLYMLLLVVNLDDYIKNTPGLTFFAPTEAAINKLPQSRLDYLVSNAGVAELKQILSYHLVTGVMPSSNLRASSTTTAPSLQGGDLTIVKSPDGTSVKVNGIANVETADVSASNGIVHFIDTILVPPSMT